MAGQDTNVLPWKRETESLKRPVAESGAKHLCGSFVLQLEQAEVILHDTFPQEALLPTDALLAHDPQLMVFPLQNMSCSHIQNLRSLTFTTIILPSRKNSQINLHTRLCSCRTPNQLNSLPAKDEQLNFSLSNDVESKNWLLNLLKSLSRNFTSHVHILTTTKGKIDALALLYFWYTKEAFLSWWYVPSNAHGYF